MQLTKLRNEALLVGYWLHATDAAFWSAFDASVLENGQTIVIPSWELAPSSIASTNVTELSIVGNGELNMWHHVPVSRCTLIGCLSAAGVSPWDDLDTLFFSNNLKSSDQNQTFNTEWLYRREFTLSLSEGRHYFLETHGITPGADILINGEQIANRTTQAGAYGGHTYDITSSVSEANALLITVHPANYDRDFAQSFVDWNPSPPDNGTGIWRNITLKQTGPVRLNPMGFQTVLKRDYSVYDANFTAWVEVRNLEDRTVTVQANMELYDPQDLKILGTSSLVLDLQPNSLQSFPMKLSIEYAGATVWWPRQWGRQPLLRAQLNVTVDGALSDWHQSMVGLREVTSKLNEHGDLVFYVNGQPFQVRGAGYSPDLFLRWDSDRFEKICEYALEIGLNTIRLEGKMEQPELYEIADRLGIMVLPGWECCDKWEAWSYNDELSMSLIPVWETIDYAIAGVNMKHEASMLQVHPCVLGFMIGSDFYPDDNATAVYEEALRKAWWDTPIISSGSQRGHPALLGPSGMKMDGPYDWVPPNYWWDKDPAPERKGAAFGFGSELGAGVGTPEIGSLSKFLRKDEIDQLWQAPNASSYHNGIGKTFASRKIYNNALYARYGAPTDTADYLQKAQMMDYEATRAQFEAYAANWNAKRPATGMIYWMLNNAWPSLHWNLFDYYLRPAGSYFGAKIANLHEHVAYDYKRKEVYWINHDQPVNSVNSLFRRTVHAEAIDMNGKQILNKTVKIDVENKTIGVVMKNFHGLGKIKDIAFLRLRLMQKDTSILSRNVYWLAKDTDKLAWEDSEWYYTPVKKYANYTALNHLPRANMTVTARRIPNLGRIVPNLRNAINVTLTNHSPVPAVFIRLNLVNKAEEQVGGGSNDGVDEEERWEDVVPVKWEENYVTLWPHETMVSLVRPMAGTVKAAYLQVDGKNVDTPEIVEIIDD